MVTRRERAGLLALVFDVYCENHNKHTLVQSFGLAAHKNSTFLNLALAVSVCLLASMGASFDFKCAYD